MVPQNSGAGEDKKNAYEKGIREILLSPIRIDLFCSARHPCYYVSSPQPPSNNLILMTHPALSLNKSQTSYSPVYDMPQLFWYFLITNKDMFSTQKQHPF